MLDADVYRFLKDMLKMSADEMLTKREELLKRFTAAKTEAVSCERWLSADDVCEAVGISRTTFFERVKEGKFPKGIYFGARLPRWRLSDIERSVM
ncbi:MAG: AlpA family phage regulatory protein [Synergistaceae bacterium]|nr:AlpA family phage regulatory protein [Synergistaceae bacterium]